MSDLDVSHQIRPVAKSVAKHHRSVGGRSQVYRGGRAVVVVQGPEFMPVVLRMASSRDCRDTVSSHSFYLTNYTLFVYSYVSCSPTSMTTPECDLTRKV